MMKKSSVLLALLALALVVGLAFVGCKSDNGAPPVLSDVFLVTEVDATVGNWTAKTSFTTTDKLAFNVRVKDPDGDFSHWVWTVKQGATVLIQKERYLWANEWPNISNRTDFTYGPWFDAAPFAVGSYTFETYAVDENGNKSNTVTIAFTVS